MRHTRDDELGRKLISLKRPRIGILDVDRHYGVWSRAVAVLYFLAVAPAMVLALKGVVAVGIWLAACAFIVLLVRSLPFYVIDLHEEGLAILQGSRREVFLAGDLRRVVHTVIRRGQTSRGSFLPRRDIHCLTISVGSGRQRLEIFARRERETWALQRFAQHFHKGRDRSDLDRPGRGQAGSVAAQDSPGPDHS